MSINPLNYLREAVIKSYGDEIFSELFLDPKKLDRTKRSRLKSHLEDLLHKIKIRSFHFPDENYPIERKIMKNRDPDDISSGYVEGVTKIGVYNAFEQYVDAFIEWLDKGKARLGGRNFEPENPLTNFYPTPRRDEIPRKSFESLQ
ncbi:hypothetical protein GF361_04480 [Candidatus Woesearchaeota archaeon]|nr:hypothetical protein [Candidatus Woesearchaeota archaeon]